MKTQWIAIAYGVACLVACESRKAPVKPKTEIVSAPPKVFFIEAESCEILGEKAEDGKASGLAYLKRQSGSYPPVFRCDIPVAEKPLSVWLRRKGGALQVKASVAGEQNEGRWVQENEDQFIWTYFGEFPVGEEGRQLIVTGSGDEDETVSIDCILFSEGPVDDKDALLTPLPPVSIDPAKTTGGFRSAPGLWGVNLYSGTDPKTLADEAYSENIAYLAPAMVRVHNADMLEDSGKSRNGLLDFKSRTWDEQKVRMAVVGLLELMDAGEIVINIPNWPEWMDADKDGFLDDDKVMNYVALVGRFAEIVWEFPGAHDRVLFEITSEQDKLYHTDLLAAKKPHRIAELSRIFLKCAERIREAAPGALIGGPSADPYNTAFHEQFIALTAPGLDFYSMHFFTSGNTQESDSGILSRVDSIIQPLKSVKDILRKNSKDREIPVSINEYNTVAGTDPIDPRMTTGFGAVREAWFMMTLFSAGADSASVWNENEGIYGKFSTEGERLPSAYLYHVLNTEFRGQVARLETGEPDDIAALTTESGNRILISHCGLRDREISLPEGKWTGWMIGKGMDVPRDVEAEGMAVLSGVSVLYLERE